jgi:predicted permease
LSKLETPRNPDIEANTVSDEPRSEFLSTLSRELRHAARVLLRTPAFSLIVFITLALGIGATTAIYTVLDAVVLRPLAYRHADRLVSVLHPATVPGNGESKWGLSSAGYFYFKAQNHTLEDLGGYRTGGTVINGAQSSELVRSAEITASMFSTLQAHAELGRLIAPEDDRPGAAPVVVLSFEYWQRHFGGDRAVLNTMLQASDGGREIIGVAERGLTLPKPGPFGSTSDLASFGVDLWVPLNLDPNARPQNSHQYSGIGRLKPGVTAEAAQRDLAALMGDFTSRFPTAYTARFMKAYNFRVGVTPLRDEVLGPNLSKTLWILFGAVAVVLCIACANVANLFLVRMEARRRDSAIRTALGADRAQMAVHFLSESLLLALSSGLAGILVARLGLGVLLRIAPTDIPRLSSVGLGASSIVVALGLSLLAGVVFGLIPLARTSVDVATLREGGRGLTSSRRQRMVRRGLVVGQVALALMLLASAGLMLRSFANLRNVKAGLDPRGVLTFETVLPYQEFKEPEQVAAFQRQFQERVAALPGVRMVGASEMLPLQDYNAGCSGVQREGRPFPEDEKPPCVAPPAATPGFFEALGIQVRGRTPAWSDVDPSRKRATVAVVTAALAQRLWPGEDAIGKGIAVGNAQRGYYHVIGVIPELRAQGLEQPPTEAVITAEASGEESFVVRASNGDLLTLLPSIRRILTEMNPRVAVMNPRTMQSVVDRSMARSSFIMMLLGIAGSMALLLSAVGIFGVISYLVTQRRGEIGVRVALGARAPQVVALVLGESMRLTVLGLGIGLVGALAGMRVLRSLLFEVSPTDPVVLIGASVVLVLTTLLASATPTRRAAKIDPVEAMRVS